MLAETTLRPEQLVLPLFVNESLSEPRGIPSMPGVHQHTLTSLRPAVEEANAAGIGGVMLFGVPARRDAVGTAACDPDGVLSRAIAVAAEVSDGLVMSDVCLDEFTDHGHCGVLRDDGSVDNDATLERYAEMACVHAEAGADVLGLSGMMDGQVGAVRDALEPEHEDVAVLAYAAKYASGWYGPFRDAVDSQLEGDRRTYQQDPANRREARREAALDIDEGADILMVKPALGYLDVLSDIAAMTDLPVWSYQVSGEYAAIEAAAANGWLDRETLMLETLVGIRRAGAAAILSYWALPAARLLS